MQTALIPIATDAAVKKNVVTVHLLALCPMLAVSVSLPAAASLGLLTTLVMTVVGGTVAALRHWVVAAVRLPVLLILVAAMVGVLDLLMAIYAPQMHRELGIFLPLIITNCAVLARLEVFALHQPPLAAATDGAATGLGMTAALLLLALLRELLGRGTLAGWEIFPHFAGMPLALQATGGFILFALMLAGKNLLWKA